MPQSDAPFALLFVCTGNICRSPTAEMLFRTRVNDAGAGAQVTVASAGLGTEDGWRIDPTVAQLLERRGVEGQTKFRSRALTSEILSGADLVLTGTREHRLRIGKCWPDYYERTLTLRECVALLRELPPQARTGLPADIAKRARTIVSWLQKERGLVATPEDGLDISDPIGRRASAYRRMVDEVSAAVDELSHILLAVD